MLFSKFDAYAMMLGTLSSGVEVSPTLLDIKLGYDRHSSVQAEFLQEKHTRTIYRSDRNVALRRSLQAELLQRLGSPCAVICVRRFPGDDGPRYSEPVLDLQSRERAQGTGG